MTALRPRWSRLCRLFAGAAVVCILSLAGGRARAADAAPVQLQPGDHVSLIGNTLPDRMQHDGWLETFLQSRLPQHNLVVRDLGFSGDELTLRLRSKDFGTPDEWLTRTKTDVVFAFFGYNESWAGQAGLEKFRGDLTNFIKQTLAQKYNGRSAPRLVLFSPIAFEDLDSPNLPDGRETNRRIELYTRAMADVAKASGVGFVDLYHPTAALYEKTADPLTINGVHLNGQGNQRVAEVIDAALFGTASRPDPQALDDLRQAVLDKNFHWFNRYRTTDGYSIYGGRADLKFVGGQTNRVVMQREMEVLDVLTANRDRKIWAVAQGKDYTVDDSNTPPFIPVQTNKPGAGPNGTHLFLGGEESIKAMTVAKGMQVSLFASEEMFPELINPVQMAFDTKGRLWVAAWPTYPHWKPKTRMNDKLLILEDTNGDGRADRCITFADGLHNPTGFEFWGGGVLVAMAPDLLFLKDTDGDDKADVRLRVLDGLDSADTHHTSNSFLLGPGGGVFFQEGTFHHTQVETPYGPTVRNANAGVYRYDPRTQKFDVYVTFGFANPHGHAFDRWGQDIVVDGTGANPYDAALFSGHMEFPQKHGRPPQVYQQRTRPCPGIEVLSSRHFPEENQGNLLVGNVIGFQGILQYKLENKGASLVGTEVEPIVSSTDPNFRPVDFEIGPDGALWFTDWQNPIIGHMQHNLRDPSRDTTHGRVYRVTYKGRELLKPEPIAGEPIAKLLDLLKSPEDRVRYRTRIELSARETDDVIPAVKQWLAALDKGHPEYEHHRLEGLWLYQQHDTVNADLLKQVLRSPNFHARAAATRVLSYWHDRVDGSLDLLKTLAADEHPRVRLEAVRAASFYTVPEAVEVPLISMDAPSDQYLDFVRGETMKTLEPYWKKALAEGRKINVTSDAGARFFLRNLSLDQLLKMDRNRAVYIELLFRPGVRDEYRREALAGLAKLEKKSPMNVLLDAIRGQDERQTAQDESVVFDLIRLITTQPAGELAKVRGELESLALKAKLPITRQLGFVALMEADDSVDRAWELATQSAGALRDLLAAMPMIPDAGLRASLYPRVVPLLDHLPPQLASHTSGHGTVGRFVRIELPGKKRTLTLAEVEVYSDGRNVALQGKATQKSTAHGGAAARGIDGVLIGDYGSGGQTHTEENTPDPWWELDLGHEYPIDSIRIYNRSDGNLGQRLKGFTLKVLDAQRHEVTVKKDNPAPKRSEFKLGGGGPESQIRRAAMVALTSVRGQETPTFQLLARFVRQDIDRHAAVQAMQRIPAAFWPPADADPLLDSLIGYLKSLPPQERTSPAALDALQTGYALTALLPADQARALRQRLGELGVRIVRIGTVPHQMLFDKERLAVQAGKPVEFAFENTDIMPHNFVITVPGALEEIGQLAEKTATQPGVIQRHYVPVSSHILLSSELLQPRMQQKLTWTAPTQPGVYPYVCTYPGHWRRMYGALYVVGNLDEYLADPEGYLAAHPLPIKDDLLKFVRPRKEWKFEDLAESVAEMHDGRSFSTARQIFTVASCVACHKLNGDGREIGPDLSKLDPKYGATDILKEILDPSAKINEKFQTWTFITDAGKPITGLVIKETPDEIQVLENPLAKADPIRLKPSEIVEREKSKTSIMPKGLLDKLTHEEILDLIAYITARGNANSPLFQGGHNHAAGGNGHDHGGH